ncbi:cAMP-dependent protein kinase type II regulatory subunit-like [Agrilus planipennis]|uniref:cAMP-dependent protein kinase type II regulatory subunit-like n=1 Tax=Agrilus planipennis TaxID=224129 RepID=A0A7F5R546_AGRPL|nr:cAMP-dependent protein kinase type II regulatory subunit-like [Agrilus planipennis]
MDPTRRYKCKDQIKEQAELDEEFKDMFMELSLNILLDHPTDHIGYSVDFFQKMQDSRHTRLVYDIQIPEPSTLYSEDYYDDDEPQLEFRRSSVVGEYYNPDETFFDATPIYPKNDQQLYYIQKTVNNVFLFRILDENTRNALINAMYEVIVSADEVIVKEGEKIDKFYIVGSGSFYVIKTDEETFQPMVTEILQNSRSFGQVALLHEANWDSTIQAMTDGTLWALERATYHHFAVNFSFLRRKYGEKLINKVLLLSNLPPGILTTIAELLDIRTYSPGERIIKESDKPDGVYFVINGSVVLTFINNCGLEELIRKVAVEDCFGEVCLVTDKPRSFSAYASEEEAAEVFFLEKAKFERVLGPTIDVLRENICLYQQQKRKMDFFVSDSCYGEL